MSQPAVLTDPRPPGEDTLSFSVTDVTETFTHHADGVPKGTSTGAVTRALTALAALPADVPWALRDDSTSALLDESQPIGDQIETGSRVTLIPKTHLG